MKTRRWVLSAVIFGLVASAVPAAGGERLQENYLGLSFFINPLYAGLQHRVTGNFYIQGSLEYMSDHRDLQLQVGSVFMIPRKIFIFRFYGGGGVQFTRNRGYQYPYLALGTKFWVLFWEIDHPLEKNLSPQYRFGFSFGF